MKKIFIITSIFLIIFLTSLFTIKPLIITLAKNQLGKVFVQSRVSVAKCSLRANKLSFFDVEISRQGVYNIKVQEADIQYDIFSILRHPFLKVYLKNANFSFNAPGKNINDISVYFNLNQKGPQILSSVDISGFGLDINTQNLSLKAAVSVSLNLKESLGQGDLNIPELKYDKLTVSDIKGKIKLKGMNLSLYEASAKMLEGDIEGQLDLAAGKEIQYSAKLKCNGLDIQRFVRDFDLREKFDITGKLSGNLKLQGQGARLEILDGSFSTLSPGGRLVISNMQFLENMARDTKQPVDLLVESFKNYAYNTGVMSLSLMDNDVILKIELEGQAGKRELNVIAHDFKF